MAQIFGCITSGDAPVLPDLLRKMGRLQQRPSQTAAETWIDESTGVGMGGLFSREQGCMATLDTAEGTTGMWLMDGEIYRLSPAVDRADRFDERQRLADEIPSLYQHFGSDFASHLDGSFCVAMYDSRRKTFILA